MSIVDAIKKLREQLTGEPGKGASITDAINDLTEGLTGDPGVGASIADALSNLADHADDISGGGGGGEVVLPIVTVNIDSMTYTCTIPYNDLVSLIENSPYQAHNASDMFPDDPPILPICADNFGEERAYGYAWNFNMPGYVSGIHAYLIYNNDVSTIFLYADGSISPTPKQGI